MLARSVNKQMFDKYNLRTATIIGELCLHVSNVLVQEVASALSIDRNGIHIRYIYKNSLQAYQPNINHTSQKSDHQTNDTRIVDGSLKCASNTIRR